VDTHQPAELGGDRATHAAPPTNYGVTGVMVTELRSYGDSALNCADESGGGKAVPAEVGDEN
jgi:hypothetical protein